MLLRCMWVVFATIPACVVSGIPTGIGVSGAPIADGLVESPPPPPRVEVTQARPGYTFIAGRWMRQNGQWQWLAGHWEREHAGYAWSPGNWRQVSGGWLWVEGRWE